MSATSEENKFARIVSRETVLGFKVDPEYWTDAEQTLLHEGMILAWKENPDWTNEEALKVCKEHVENILFNKFHKEFGFLISQADVYGYGIQDAFQFWRQNGIYKFLAHLNDQMELTKFYDEFYDDLRELYNIDSSGMDDEYNKMKKNGWTFRHYRVYLKTLYKKRQK
jgi:hypothetical protein